MTLKVRNAIPRVMGKIIHTTDIKAFNAGLKVKLISHSGLVENIVIITKCKRYIEKLHSPIALKPRDISDTGVIRIDV